jgi:hypothetical protein
MALNAVFSAFTLAVKVLMAMSFRAFARFMT